MKIDILERCVGLRYAIEAMRFSWKQYADKSDSVTSGKGDYIVGINDMRLARALIKAGPSHSKFMRMIFCYIDISAPLYWWKQFDTHRFGVEKISESTMHSILVKEFSRDDFEDVDIPDKSSSEYISYWMDMDKIIAKLNVYRNRALANKDMKKHYEKMIYSMLPDSFIQKRRMVMSYQAMRNIYILRRGHKLGQWKELCDAFESIPEFKSFIDFRDDDGDLIQ